jgi:predicted dehydrogenase
MTTTIGLVGAGWRADFFLRLAHALASELTVVGAAVRRPETADRVAEQWSIPAYLSPADLIARGRPDLVIVSVPPSTNPQIVTDVVAAGVPVLCETPPALDVEGLRRLWAEVAGTRKVQVAEQYLLMPGHAARREAVRRGTIGPATSVQVSSTHGYHAVSIMRGLLGAGFGPVTVNSSRFTAPLVDPLGRDGWSDDDTARPASTIIATIDFGDGLSGVYDFTDNQWHNQLRHRRIVIRGARGEIVDDSVVRLAGPHTILRSSLVRSQLGYDLNLDGYDTELISLNGDVLYRNPFVGHRLMDEEIAIATLMTGTARWVRDEGPPPYPLAQACQDQLVSLAVEDSVRTGSPARTEAEAWGRDDD